MTVMQGIRALALLGSAALLAACGNAGNDTGRVLRQLPQALTAGDPEPLRVSPAQVAEVLSKTSGPLNLIQLETIDAQFMMLQIERNSPYQTFASSNRQVINFRDGMITSTRGLGGDMMSTEEDALLSQVRSRSDGVANYTLRFLTPEDRTQTLNYTCYVNRAGTAPVTGGQINAQGVVMTASCRTETEDFTNTFVVDGGGFILSTRQWAGETLGYISAQALRR